MKNYHLTNDIQNNEAYLKRVFRSIKEIGSYLNKKSFFTAVFLALLTSAAAVLTPYLLAHAIDTYIAKNDLAGLLRLIFLLAVVYVVSSVTQYFQQMIMGRASMKALYKIRGVIFAKIQSLPIAFFNQNKAGDLMSRINNDSDKLSQFLSESILRFTGSVFTLLGIAIFVLYLNWKLGLVLLSSTVFLVIVTRFVSPQLEKANKQSSGALGQFTAGVSEQLSNFKAIIAFNRRNFFDEFLNRLNSENYMRSRKAGFLNQIFSPLYDFAGYIAQAVVLVYGLYLISQGELTVGLLIGFLTFALRFYDPLRFIANIFGEIQVSLASWGRIKDILTLDSDIVTLPAQAAQGVTPPPPLVRLAFKEVSFTYGEDHVVLDKVSFALEKGKTYALVGPTGGGKSTIASLMARLYDPTDGVIEWEGRDMRTLTEAERAERIGVILQEPYLFSGTVEENIRYGNAKVHDKTEITDTELLGLLSRLPDGLATKVETGGESISIGQRQLISFVRTVLRKPDLLILDEATANIDTVTESALQELINSLPPSTTKVIIAHRLNTITQADEILFVRGGKVQRVSNEKEVLKLLTAESAS